MMVKKVISSFYFCLFYKIEIEEKEQLFEAAKNGDFIAVEDAIKNGVHVNSKDENGDTALLIVLRNRHIELAKFLIENGATF